MTQKSTTIQELLLDNQLCFTIYACSREITKLYQPFLDKLGLTYSQYIVMLVLWEKGQCAVKEIGAALYLDSGTLTPLLKRLQAAGLIIRERSQEDERKVLISPTDEGWALQDRAKEIPGVMVEGMKMSKEEFGDLLLQFRSLLNRVHQANSRC
ncbi:DNA-binding transcriptional regulator, MarR family [Paenibacillus sophorae]|uniref:DNA-binding transcriptional regulator, MarR family n=1 Tax=Paenibacillus sophorae TaxID=1333845 RepID=A0A1H8GE82_9BACL|nr:MarR family transcriptional regulator [Paenibacillus sophorae]QWU14186.1 MarR family transcriptional regulator [Paenibacillus sophorae]SEN42085.1 DNA-binding transcriptional regulator, MarR family [Paenibacillus sophorae]